MSHFSLRIRLAARMARAVGTTRGKIRDRQGFTLLEMMMVIIIIMILAGLLLPAIRRAMMVAREARILVEIDQIGQAMDNFKDKYGDYPPNGAIIHATPGADDRRRVENFIIKAFPRWTTDSTRRSATITHLARLSPSETLFFWLSGMPARINGALTYEGFWTNVSDPFVGTNYCTITTAGFRNNSAQQRTASLFEFAPGRIVSEDRVVGGMFFEYQPYDLKAPYAYFRADFYEIARVTGYTHTPNASKYGVCVPYMAVPNGPANVASTWVAPGRFQIICAGVDDRYGESGGVQKIYPSGANYDVSDADNLTNFASTTLEASKP